MLRTFILILLAASSLSAQNKLFDYWNRKIELDTAQRYKLSIDNIRHSSDDHLIAISYYQLALRASDYRQYAKENALYSKALDHLHKSGKRDSKLHYYILNNKAWVYKKFAQYQEAIKLYHQAMEHAPKVDESKVDRVNWNLAMAYKYVNVGDALTYFLKVKERAFDNQDTTRISKVLREIGKLYFEVEQYSNAIYNMEKAIEWSPSPKRSAYAHMSLSNVYHKLGKYDLQQAHIEKAMSYDIEAIRFECLINMGECLKSQGKKEEAKKYLHQAHEIASTRRLDMAHFELLTLLAEVEQNPIKYMDEQIKKQGQFIAMQAEIAKEFQQYALIDAERIALQEIEIAESHEKLQRDILIIFIIILLCAWIGWRYYRYKKNARKAMNEVEDLMGGI